ncbi:ATP-binding protein [Streptomyces lincolnensis]|uniref:ATP-binding protein n=1 Tax=Streptomyces lincolnensis TaxID=1915 RepID=UPI001E34C9BE|nr:ATP-binding protein [Streptomyces lincolnensis]MCD7440417.1 ATP-binding protein [Streptomyces lincolnensis]
MSGEVNHVRLLPWTGSQGQPSLLLTDGDGTVSRLADRIEDVQLGLAERLLGQVGNVLPARGRTVGELGVFAWQLADALHDALLIADCRRTRLRTGERPVLRPGGGRKNQGEPLQDRDRACPFTLLTLPGDDRASASIARRHVRDTTRAWGLPSSTTDDLETITGELVANALEHSGSPTVTVSCALSAHAVVISVTDAGTGPCKPVASAVPPRPEQERGRGLLITGALADRWGTQQAGGGLTVWAEVGLDPNEAPEHGD